MTQAVNGAVEALEQGVKIINRVTSTQYSAVCAPYVASSMGEHIRHVLDMFHALEKGAACQCVDYNFRRRGNAVEFERQKALDEFHYFIKLLPRLADRKIGSALRVKTEVLLTHTESIAVDSSFDRELIFVAGHAIHHFALIGVIAKLQNIELDAQIGVAPATASYLRRNHTCAL